jgi:hypothetical protein
MSKTFALAVTLSLLICVPAMAYPITGSVYDADKVVYLPDVPYPDCTNRDSGSIDAMLNSQQAPMDYTVVVENEYSLTRWKEFLYQLTFTQLNEQDSFMDFHVDFSKSNPNPEEPPFICEAYWNTLYAGTGSLPPLTWTIVGYPGNNPLAPQSPVLDLAGAYNGYMDLMLPPYDGTSYYDWNPEWVSLSFYGWGFAVDYDFTDWCIPEPATMTLLGLGAVALLRRKRA